MKKIVLFLLFLPTTMCSFEISYNDIINQQDTRLPYVNNSQFAHIFARLATRTQKINHLLSFCERRQNGSLKLYIKDIPTKQNLPPTSAYIIIKAKQAKNYSLDWAFYQIKAENPEETIYRLTFNDDETISMFWFAELPKGVIAELNYFNEISGSTIMRIFDGLCALCSVGKVTLEDQSKLQEFEESGDKINPPIQLNVLYPYIWGETFYERYGFIPDNLTLQEYLNYQQTLRFLTTRPLRELLHDFSHNTKVLNALKAGYDELHYFPSHLVPVEQATIRDVLYVPFVRIKTLTPDTRDPITGKTQRYSLKLLNTIYTNCLVNYRSADRAKNRYITGLQKQVRKSKFVKFYN